MARVSKRKRKRKERKEKRENKERDWFRLPRILDIGIIRYWIWTMVFSLSMFNNLWIQWHITTTCYVHGVCGSGTLDLGNGFPCSMLPGSSTGWLEDQSNSTAGCCNTLKVRSLIFLVVHAVCDWGLSWNYQSEHPNVASPCGLDSLTALWLVPSVSAETGRSCISPFLTSPQSHAAWLPQHSIQKGNQSQRPSQVWEKGKETSPLDKGCCLIRFWKRIGTRNIVEAILENDSLLQ